MQLRSSSATKMPSSTTSLVGLTDKTLPFPSSSAVRKNTADLPLLDVNGVEDSHATSAAESPALAYRDMIESVALAFRFGQACADFVITMFMEFLCCYLASCLAYS